MASLSRAPNPHIPRDNAGGRLQVAVDGFLSQPDFSDETRRSYRKTLTAMTTALEAAGAEPTAAAIEAAAQLRWGTVAPATWNRHAATIRSFLGYAARHGLLGELRVALDRRREPADRTRALPKAALERLWSRRDVALRDKTLGRLLYETAARASEALSLNVEDSTCQRGARSPWQERRARLPAPGPTPLGRTTGRTPHLLEQRGRRVAFVARGERHPIRPGARAWCSTLPPLSRYRLDAPAMSQADETKTATSTDGLTVDELRLAARNHGLPLEALRHPLTPVGLHYLLIHYDIPVADPATWRLEIGGAVERPLSLSLDELRARPAVTVPVTLDCPPPPPPPETKSKCNAGNGNGSDAITFVAGEHCYGGDPGNSYNAGNRGGDEIPTSNGVPNPGGNNHPG